MQLHDKFQVQLIPATLTWFNRNLQEALAPEGMDDRASGLLLVPTSAGPGASPQPARFLALSARSPPGRPGVRTITVIHRNPRAESRT